jgi:hypothetical protein
MTMKLRLALPAALLLAVLVLGCSSAAPQAGGSNLAASTSPDASTSDASRGDTRFDQGPLHDDKVVGISLQAALTQTGRDVPLPSTEGETSKVVFTEPPEGSSEFWISILYSSGAELVVRPGKTNLDRLAQFVGSIQFQDGEDQLVREMIGGRDVVIGKGGVQKAPASGQVVQPVALWNESGLTYTLYMPKQSPDAVKRLEKAVSSVR